MCLLILGLEWGNFDSRSLPNSGDFDYKILKMSKFPWVACTPPPHCHVGALSLAKLQQELEGVSYMIIDEYSVIGQKMFASTLPFGGISILLVGDIGQLPPICDKVLYHNKPHGEVATEGFCMYHKFEDVVQFTLIERANGNNMEQERFRKLQINARDGNSILEDWKLLLSRTADKVSHLNTYIKLSYGNETVAKTIFIN